jgi:hypothetical protein
MATGPNNIDKVNSILAAQLVPGVVAPPTLPSLQVSISSSDGTVSTFDGVSSLLLTSLSSSSSLLSTSLASSLQPSASLLLKTRVAYC